MMPRKFTAAAASAALLATPLAAQQAGAVLDRANAPVAGESELAGQATLFYILGIAALVAAIILIAEDDDDDVPVSV